jgi:ATP-dependent DNA ligase
MSPVDLGTHGDSTLQAQVPKEDGEIVFREACKLGCEGIVPKRLSSTYRRGRSPLWVKVKNPKAPAVKREAEEDWSR